MTQQSPIMDVPSMLTNVLLLIALAGADEHRMAHVDLTASKLRVERTEDGAREREAGLRWRLGDGGV